MAEPDQKFPPLCCRAHAIETIAADAPCVIRVCTRCGHPECPACGDYCDAGVDLGDAEMCQCDELGSCVYPS
jgi:hypothetical protein